MTNTTTTDSHFELAMRLFALLFVSSESISRSDLATHIKCDGESLNSAFSLLDDILEEYTPLFLSWANDRARLHTRAQYGEIITQAKPQLCKKKLSEAALQTLAFIAYNQPVTKAEIDRIRAADSEKTLSVLRELGLIKGRFDRSAIGRPALYHTTQAFLEYFGISSISDLPDTNREELV